MSSFFGKLFGRFGSSRKRTVNARKLRVETLERRQLMASDLATITGTVFTDLTDNGLTADDTRLNNVTVRLYRDGGNNGFDNGGADDTLVGTTTTNASGVYTFNDLLAGTYFVQQSAVSGTVQRATETVKTITITPAQAAGTAGQTVDSFTTNQTVSATVIGTPVSNAVPAAEALGGQREMFADLAAGASIDLIANAATPGILEFNTSATGAGTRIITYDGLAENNAAVVDGTGLGGLDLTNAGTVLAFRFAIGADQPGGDLILRAYSSATDFSQLTVAIPNTGGAASATVVARFADFVTAGGTGANFTNINALQVEFDVAASDGQLDLIETVSRTLITSNAANLNPMSVGNLVFRDNDNDGVRDAGEPGIANVSVQLYSDTNNNGAFDPATDTLVGTQTTDTNGNYSFTNLLPGNYIAVVPASQFLAAAPLFGLVTSTGAPDPDNDIDNDDNGALVGTVVATSAITLASGGEPTTDGDANTNSNLTLDFGFTPNIDLSVVKSGTATIDAGGNVTYTIAVTNNAPIAATNVRVTDNLPTGATFIPNGTNGSTSSTDWTVQANPAAELLATIATLAAGATQNYTVVVSTDPALVAGTLNNTVTVTSDGVDPTPGNNTDDADTVITRNAVLQLTKSDGTRTSVSPGDTFTYTLTVTNTGLSTANNVTLVDTLPAGYTFVSFVGTQGNPVRTVVGGLDQISAGVASLAVGATLTVGINVAVSSTIAGTTIVNTATADSDDSAPITASDTNTIVRNLDLAITKTASAATVGVGGRVTYTLAVTNNGPLAVTGVEVDDDLPTGFTLATTGNPTSIVANANATRDFVWNVGNLASGQTANVNVIVDVAPTFTPATNVTNTATIAVARLTGFTDTVATNNTATAVVAVEPRYDLRIVKSDGAATSVTTGQTYTYTIAVDNAGPNSATNVVVTDVLPAGLQFVSAVDGNNANIGSVNGQTYTATIPTLASGQTVTITMTVRVRSSATGDVVNTATVTADNIATQETGTRPNTSTDTNTLTRTVTYNVTKTGPTTPILANTAFTYTVIAFNSGTADAPNVVFLDPLPSGVTFNSGTFTVNGTGTTGTVTFNSTTNRLEANLGTLLAGGSSTLNHATITLNVTAAATASGTLANTATISGPDNQTGVNSTANITVNPNFDLTVTKSDNSTSATLGQNLVYTIVVTNSGPSPATNVVVTDTLPTTQLTFVSATSTAGTFTNNNGSVSGTIATLASGASATITVTATVRNDVPNGTVITNPVSVTANGETVTTNNSSSDTTTVNTTRNLSGFAYIDLNRNGVRDTNEPGIAGVAYALTGTSAAGAAVSLTTTTDANGQYTFNNVAPGNYTVNQTQPTSYVDGRETPGSTGGTAPNTLGSNVINAIPLNTVDSTGNNFGELRVFSKRLFMSSTTNTTI